MTRGVAGLTAVVGVLAASLALGADDLKVTAAFDRLEARPGEVVTYTVTLTAADLPRIRSFPQPDFSDFRLVAGPSANRSTQVSFVNGRMSQQASVTRSWQLVPREEGTLRIPSFGFELDGRRHQVPVAELEVRLQAASQPPSSSPGASSDPDRSPRARYGSRSRWDPFSRRQRGPAHLTDERVEVKAVVDDTEVWLGEELVVTHVLEFDTEIKRYEPEPAEFPGFQKAERETNRVGRAVRGETWQEAPIARWALVPLSTGEKVLPSADYVFHVQVRQGDIFDSVFNPSVVKVSRSTEPVQVQVRALPAGAPAGFDGAVGTFQLKASLGSEKLEAGDGTTLSVVVKGRGNFASISAPTLRLPEGLKSFDPEVSVETRPDRNGYTVGAKTYEFPLLVTEAGTHEIPPVEWAYFDPRAGRYVERRTSPLVVEATASSEPVGDLTPQEVHEVAAQDTDIHHVRTRWQPDERAGSRDSLPPWFWPSLAVGPLAGVVALGWSAGRRLGRSSPRSKRARGAATRARRRLKDARSAAREGRGSAAADSAARAVAGFVVDRVRGGGAEPPPGEVAAMVAPIDDGLAQRVRTLLDSCDFARFARGAEQDVEPLVDEAERLLDELSRRLPSTVGEVA